MELSHIDHFTLRCRPQEMAALRDFYRDLLGLHEGRRPDFAFPGHWMYLRTPYGEAPVVHIAATLPADGPPAPAGGPGATGRLDHVSFRARGLGRVRAELKERGIAYQETPVPGMPELHQVFFHDPTGLKVELTFHGES